MIPNIRPTRGEAENDKPWCVIVCGRAAGCGREMTCSQTLSASVGRLAVAGNPLAAHAVRGWRHRARFGAARWSRPAHIIKFGPVRIERITESALQRTNCGREILQHDTLPSRSRAPFGLSAAVVAYWSCERRAGFKLPVRSNFQGKIIKNWFEWSDRRPLSRPVAISLYEALRVSGNGRFAIGWFARAVTKSGDPAGWPKRYPRHRLRVVPRAAARNCQLKSAGVVGARPNASTFSTGISPITSGSQTNRTSEHRVRCVGDAPLIGRLRNRLDIVAPRRRQSAEGARPRRGG